MKRLKKTAFCLLALALVLSMGGIPLSSAEAVTANAPPTSSTVMVDGVSVSFQAFNIDDYNYYKLRDIAKVVSGTSGQFEVGYDEQENAILLTSGQAYTSVGGELAVSDDLSTRQVTASSAKIYLDGVEISPSAYLIGGNNYFRLRDIGAAIDFGVSWDGASNTVRIDTSSPYISQFVGFYDPDYYYTHNPQYHIEYLTLATGTLYDTYSDAFRIWAARLGCTYEVSSTMGNIDLYLESLETFAAQGTDGFLLDPDTATLPRIAEIMDELDLPWMTCMASSMDEDGRTLHPYVDFDDTEIGAQMAQWTIDYAKTAWPDASPSELGMLSLDFSVAPPLHERTIGAQSIWNQHYPTQTENFFVGDGATVGTLDIAAGYDLASMVFAANPDIRYWLVCACIDDYAGGAARAAESLGIADQCVVISCGGAPLIDEWDAGADTCWKAAVYDDIALATEPIICGLYALMNGDATAETLWPEWINKNGGEVYAVLQVPMIIITRDNYQEYLEFVDAYTGFNEYDYPYHGTQYPLRATPPASYNG